MNRVLFRSQSVEWPTPHKVYSALDAEFKFDFDPCPTDGFEDGLATLFTSWRGKRVFCNPPYGPQIRKWLARAHEAELVVYLLPARTDVSWFHELVLPRATEIRFLRGRLRFGQAKNVAPFPSMIVVFRNSS